MVFACFCDRQWRFQQCGLLIRRTPPSIVEPRGPAPRDVVGRVNLGRHHGRRARPELIRTRTPSANIVVGEEAAFDEPYNIALQPAIGAPPAGRARTSRRRYIRVGDHATPAVDSPRALARAARG